MFGSAVAETPGPVRVAGEGAAIAGYDTRDGFYLADLFAHGIEIGGHDNYGGRFSGAEYVTGKCGRGERIDLTEGSIGAEIPFLAGAGLGAGYYKMESGEKGVFFFVGGGGALNHGATRFGLSF